MKKILIIGGAPKSLIKFRGKLLESLIKNDYDVVACASGDCKTTVKQLTELGVGYIPASINRTSLNPFHDLFLLFQFISIIRRVKPDLILTYTIKPSIYGLIAARINFIKRRYAIITGLGYAFTSRDHFLKKILGFIVSNLYSLSLTKASTVFFQNNDDLDLFRQMNIINHKTKTIRLMGSGVDIEHYQFSKITSEAFNFLLIARLLRDKGIYEYVEAARIVKKNKSNLDINFLLIGSYDSNPSSIKPKIIEDWVSKKYITYIGEVNDVRPYIEKCSVFVLPSYREGLPRSTLEAMSIGRAIITTNVPGCRDTVLNNINGLLVPVKNSEELAVAMLSIINNNLKNEMGIQSRKIVEEKFDVDKVNKVILKEMGI
jgi:glycosyltransferase involved in cell wall biosynthesis